ncbi:MAG: biopolymer transporter ExbD [Sphingobacteriia bacterium]|nr:biopolymer transporter ExbD [Sphingobacteriia bacterium]NCC40974.1 biopolymer transporter ExbD [Gammaproteobacteria bacterium]
MSARPWRARSQMRRSRLTAPRERGDDHLIPLINVVFLLLIFFMIAGQLMSTELFQVRPPIASYGDAAAPERLVLLVSADGRLALDGEALSAEDLQALLALRVRGEQAREPGTEPQVSLKADAGLTIERLRPLLDALRQAGVTRVALLAEAAP